MCSVAKGEDHSLDKYLYSLSFFPQVAARILSIKSDCQLNLCVYKDRLFSGVRTMLIWKQRPGYPLTDYGEV